VHGLVSTTIPSDTATSMSAVVSARVLYGVCDKVTAAFLAVRIHYLAESRMLSAASRAVPVTYVPSMSYWLRSCWWILIVCCEKAARSF
jgi:hypothetical protein